ncbi:spinster family MFS transporter [Sphingomonas canadensis]|uniref:Spinster family MFS transporter n=1 Tax=Sphingomonas canadensis TaxID=1219257 RepID=A0ABW3H364_9SPHN|nr:MFS transporter [Sphingomonas canadensis]MCW3834461.1 MFS transporter [Sphingomonas canadensis]
MSAGQRPAAAGAANAPAYVLALLTMVSFFNYLDRMVIAILLEPIKLELGLSDSQLGLIVGFAFAMLYATMGLPLARLADRHSRITLLTVCLAAWSAMTALTGLARNFTELFMARMAVGIGEAGCGPAAHSILGDLYSRERRPLAISIFQAGGVLGQSAGLALAGIVAHLWGWRAALVTVGVLGIPLALLIAFTVREPARGAGHAQASPESMLATLRALFARPPLRHLILGVSIAAFGSYGMLQWMPAFYIRLHGLSLAEVGGYVGAMKGGASVLGTVFGGLVLTRLGPRDVRWELWWPMAMFSISPLFYLVSFIAADWHVALGLQMIGAFIAATAGGVALSALQTYAEPHRRATALAILMLISSLLGLGLGPVVVGGLSDLLAPSFGPQSLRYALMGAACMPLWGAFHFWRASRSAKRWSLA